MKSFYTKRWMVWITILFTACLLRFPGVDWDQGYALHPDERYLVDISRKVSLYANPSEVDPQFPYGHLPLYLISPLFPAQAEADPLFAARLFSGLLGVLLVAVTGAAGRLVGKDEVGWAAALTIAFAPLLIQSARFYTVDSLATAAAAVALVAVMHKRWGIAGMSGAIAVASKISLLWVWLVLMGSLFCRHHKMLNEKIAQHNFMRKLVKLSGWGIFTYFITSPWMILTPFQCLMGPFTQLNIVAGRIEVPYTLQYNGTLPYLYPLIQMAIWGMGPVCTVVGIGALFVGIVRWQKMNRVNRIILLWIVCYGLVMGGIRVKFPRYYLPLYPWIAILAVKAVFIMVSSRSQRILRILCICLLLLPTVLMGTAQVTVYNRLHPWVTASQWMTDNLIPGSSIVYEAWDHPLPLLNIPNPYDMTQLPVYDEESSDKVLLLTEMCEAADVVVIASRRAYGALSRNAHRYQDTLLWYEHFLESDNLHIFTQCPKLGPIAFSDDPLLDNGLPVVLSLSERCNTPYVIRLPELDESFRVYDTPMVILTLESE